MGTKRLMPYLRIETATSTETDKAITTLKQENRELKEQIGKLEIIMEKIHNKVFHEKIESKEYKKMLQLSPGYVELCERAIYEHEERVRKEEEYLARNPEARAIREVENREEQYIMNSSIISKKTRENDRRTSNKIG